jgi:hypothetical protein
MTRNDAHPDDPRALVAEAYRMEALAPEDARAIFFDWALGLPEGADAAAAARRLLAHHAAAPDGHPMTALLREAAAGAAPGRGRTGRRRREG